MRLLNELLDKRGEESIHRGYFKGCFYLFMESFIPLDKVLVYIPFSPSLHPLLTLSDTTSPSQLMSFFTFFKVHCVQLVLLSCTWPSTGAWATYQETFFKEK